jgi:hypothetical protein
MMLIAASSPDPAGFFCRCFDLDQSGLGAGAVNAGRNPGAGGAVKIACLAPLVALR